jgi:hypothetical protein
MDHILANTDNPVPPLEEQSSSTSTTNPDEGDEDDQEGLAAHIKKMGGSAGEELVAKVCFARSFGGR